MMWSQKFWQETLERAIKSAAQFAVLVWGATTFTAVGDVAPVAGATALAALSGFGLSVLTSLASLRVGPVDSPSVVE
jgi:hypothetical protein